MYYYSIDGKKSSRNLGTVYQVYVSAGQKSHTDDSIIYDLDRVLVSFYDIFERKLFNTSKEYNDTVAIADEQFLYAGLSSESKLSSTDYERIIKDADDETRKLAYIQDCFFILRTIQSLIIQADNQFCSFYISLAELNEPPRMGTITLGHGKMTTDVYTHLSGLFISYSSIFDLLTKLAYELKNLMEDFSKNPKLCSKNIKYKNFSQLGIPERKATIYENCETVKTVLNIRNDLIHGFSWQFDNPVYFRFENQDVVERFLLFPDRENGVFKKVLSRNRFFANETKLNQLLPDIHFEIMTRVSKTVELISAYNSKWEQEKQVS